MGTGGFDLWNSGVWLIPVILIATLIILILLIQYWRRKTQQDVKDLRGELRRVQSRRRELWQAYQEHSEDDPEPYGSRVVALRQPMQEIDGRITVLEHQHVSIQERMRRLASSRWQATVGAPYFWYLLRRDVAGVRRGIGGLDQMQAVTGQTLQGISALGWDIAQQAREAQEIDRQVERLLAKLRERGLRGEAFESAERQEGSARAALAEIPRFFLTGDQEAVVQQADKSSITRAHELLAGSRPVLDQLAEQARAWERQQAEAAAQVNTTRQSVASLEQSLDGASEGLDLSTARGKFDQLQVIARNLHATLSRLEAESIESVVKEAQRVQSAAVELDSAVKKAKQQVSVLEVVINDLNGGIKLLSAQIASLGTSAKHPIKWDQSKSQLTELSRQAAALGPARKPRPPEQVNQDLVAASRLNEQQKVLTRRLQQLAQEHTELLALLDSPGFRQGREWCQSALRLAARTAGYDPENWPKADAVADLPDQLQELDRRLQSPLIANPSEPVTEAEVSRRLQETRQLAQEAQALSGRAERIQARLAEIQQGERQAREHLEAARLNLHQIGLLVRSNALLGEPAAQEANRLQAGLQQAAAELEDRQQGSLEKKTRSIAALLSRLEQAGNTWIDQLNKDLEAQRKALSEMLTSLEGFTTLDEPAVGEARRQLSDGQALTSSFSQRSRFPLDQILVELKRRSDHWQGLVAANRSLQDVAQPLVEAYNDAIENREYAREQMAEIASWIRSSQGWPPTSISLTSERQELARLEDQWEALRQQRARALQLVAQLTSLSGRYQAVADRAAQQADRAVQEQAQVESVEAELDDLVQLWQSQWNTYQNNSVTHEAIRKLLGELDHERELIKRQYRQGSKNYQQALQALQTLRKKARMSQVSIDDTHVIDVHGRVIAFR